MQNRQSSDLPLSGVRILDLTRLFPGAYCTHLLQGLGAEVIKVENPDGGDPLRATGPQLGQQGALFSSLNAGKKSLTLDLRKPAGADLFKRLAASADVVVEGNRPGVLDRLGLGWDSLKRVRASLVLCSITGYGQHGERALRAGHDLNYTAVAGALALNGPAAGLPVPFGLQVADFAGGLNAALAISAALFGVRGGAEGTHLDISLTGAVVDWLRPQIAQWQADHLAPQRGRQPLTGLFPCYRVYRCADGADYSVAALEPRFWTELCSALGEPALAQLQYDDSTAAHARVEAVFASRPSSHWQAVFRGRDVCAEPVSSLPQAAQEFPLTFAAGPALGEHTEALLREVGVDEAAIAGLRADGVV